MNVPVTIVILDDVDHDLLNEAPTPHFDEWKANARDYQNFWARSRCANARAALLSGRESHRTENLIGWGLHQSSDYELATGQTLAELCPGESGLFGKGHTSNATDWPLRAGFTHGRWTAHNLNQSEGSTGYYDVTWQTPEGPLHTTGYATAVLSIAAGMGPLVSLRVLSFHTPHVPYDIPPKALCPTTWEETGGEFSTDTTEGRRTIARAKLEAWDTCMGLIFSEAQQNGRVLMIFADNGASAQIGVGGGKNTLYESGLRVPMYVSGPMVQAGVDYSPIQITDVYATTIALRGGHHTSPDAMSFYQTFSGVPGPRRWLYADAWQGIGIDPRTLPDAEWGRAVKWGTRWKLIREGGVEEFYDLEADPDERFDLLSGDLTGEQSTALDACRTNMAAHFA